MRIKLIYRNYKPLHSLYESFVNSPPSGVEYYIPDPNTRLISLYKYYRRFKYLPLAKFFIRVSENLLFSPRDLSNNRIDLYQYINMIDKNPPAVPFIVDIEHAASLTSFTPDKGRLKSVISFLTDEQCIAITCLSVAAKKSLKRLLADDFKLIAKKVYVIYPALERMSSIKPDYEYLSKETRRLKLLFVGNQAYLKGLEELLVAIKAINRDLGSEKLELHIISDDAQKLVGKYKAPNVYLYKPTFSRRAIVSKFFIPADVFIMPTKEDTFGMAILDSLSSGTAVITTAQFALPELVNDGEDGILLKLNAPILDRTIMPDKEGMKAITTSNKDKALAIEIENVLKEIINGKIDIKKMGAKGPKKFSDGQKFSIQNRNKQLLKLYKGAINQT